MTEENELLEIWNSFLRKEQYETRRDMKKSGQKTNKHLIRYIVYRDRPTFIQYFWNLKQKIDDLKKENEELNDLLQPRKITNEDKKRILKNFFEDDLPDITKKNSD